MQSAFRIARASPTPPLSSSTARANDLATGCKPLRSLCPPATLRTTHTLLQCPIPSPPLPLSSSRARRSTQSRSARSFASRELLCAWRSTPLPARPTSLFSDSPFATSISSCPAIFPRNYLTFAVSFVRLLPFLAVENSFMRHFSVIVTRISFAFLALPFVAAPIAAAQTPKFSVSFAKEKSATPLDGRLLLLLSTDPSGEPRNQISISYKTQIVFGVDVGNWQPGQQLLVIDGNAFGYPVRYLHDVKPGKYFVQAVLHRYETFHRADGHTVKLPMDRGEGQHWNLAPGNFYNAPQKIALAGNSDKTFTIELDREIPPIPAPKDTKFIRHVRVRSELLSKFWGRPIYLGANILVPAGFDEHTEAHFPVAVFEGHFPADFEGFRTEPPDVNLKPDYSDRFHISGYNRIEQQEAYKFYQQWTASGFPRFLVVEIQHANPYYDDSYAVNSANLGPYGDAIETELMPAVEKQFRGIGQGWARFLYGGSTGGWEALAVQMFYPDHYNGAFAACPDPVDFRAYTTIDLYKDKNAFYIEGPHMRVPQPGVRD